MIKLLVALLASLLLLNIASSVSAEYAASTEGALFEDLGAELLKTVSDNPAALLDQQLLDQLGEELGIQQAPRNDRLSEVVKHMQAAQTLLMQRKKVGRASSAQAKALTGIDAMIAELTERQSQCKGGQSNKPGQSKPGRPKPGSSSKAGKSPAKAASSSTNSDADLSTERAVAGELVKDLWGKLPERQRQQILQPLSEEFLPKYASEIEAYFRALADPSRNAVESP